MTQDSLHSSIVRKLSLPIIWIFTEGEGYGIESRLSFKIFSALSLPWKLDNPYCYIDREDLDSVLSAAQFLKIRGLIRHDSEDEEDLVETNSVNEPRWDTFFLVSENFYFGHFDTVTNFGISEAWVFTKNNNNKWMKQNKLLGQSEFVKIRICRFGIGCYRSHFLVTWRQSDKNWAYFW